MNIRLVLLQVACLAVLVLGRKKLKCKPPQIKFCNACRDVAVVSKFAFKDCQPGYKLVDGYCQTNRRSPRARHRRCLPDEGMVSHGSCRKKKRSLKSCADVSEDLAKLRPV